MQKHLTHTFKEFIWHIGTLCQFNHDECSSIPCQHGSTCVDKYGFYQCSCLPGWTGNPAAQLSTLLPCFALQISFLTLFHVITCCSFFHKLYCLVVGLNCEVNIDECESFPCQNHGTCEDAINGYTCHCHSGVTGRITS